MAVLNLDNVSKHFGAIQAVNDVSLSIDAGEVVGLMGDNGAGKSTLVKMIAGNFLPSQGSMKMDGREIVLNRPIEARQHGIERDAACGAERGQHVAVRQRADDFHRLSGGQQLVAAQHGAELLDALGRPAGQVGEGSVFGLAGLAVALP